MEMKGYSTLPRSPELWLYHQCKTQDNPFCRGAYLLHYIPLLFSLMIFLNDNICSLILFMCLWELDNPDLNVVLVINKHYWLMILHCKPTSGFILWSSVPPVSFLSASTTISFTFTFMFHKFFSSLARSRYLSIFHTSFIFILVGWLVVRFYGISTFFDYLILNLFLYK